MFISVALLILTNSPTYATSELTRFTSVLLKMGKLDRRAKGGITQQDKGPDFQYRKTKKKRRKKKGHANPNNLVRGRKQKGSSNQLND